ITNARLHRREADQLGIELVEHIRDVGLTERRVEIEASVIQASVIQASVDTFVAERLSEHRVHETNIPRSGRRNSLCRPTGRDLEMLPDNEFSTDDPPAAVSRTSAVSNAPGGLDLLRATARSQVL